ncbi:MAG: superoxide dismutase [Ruminococcus sp.]|nr:superoxide dismutase [Ruminococcus sp.]
MICYEHYPFSVRPLPYPAKSLSPYLTARTLKIHHDGHYAAYIQNLNKILECFPQYHHLPLEALLLKQAFLPSEIRSEIKTNAGGAFNHMLYFECIAPPSRSKLSDSFRKIICDNFSSVENLLITLKNAALSIKGSGFAYLASDMSGKMHILALKDFETPIEQRLNPLLPIDMWEHAYYLQYQYHKKDYLNSFMRVINWQRVEMNYFSA